MIRVVDDASHLDAKQMMQHHHHIFCKAHVFPEFSLSTMAPNDIMIETLSSRTQGARRRGRRHLLLTTTRVSALAMLLLLMVSSSTPSHLTTITAVKAFTIPPVTRTRTSTTPILKPSTPKSSLLHMSWASQISDFYATYPIASAVLTCGFKASLADGIAQFQTMPKDTKASSSSIELRRNLAYVLYGALFVGPMCHVEYNILFPLLFGTEQPHVLEKVLLDDFVSAPLMWLPPAYLIKAFVYEYPYQDAVKKYLADIQQNGLLWRYWAIWVPAQTVSFSLIPPHLRVAWMASVGFFWFILFSIVASSSTCSSREEELLLQDARAQDMIKVMPSPTTPAEALLYKTRMAATSTQ